MIQRLVEAAEAHAVPLDNGVAADATAVLTWKPSQSSPSKGRSQRGGAFDLDSPDSDDGSESSGEADGLGARYAWQWVFFVLSR